MSGFCNRVGLLLGYGRLQRPHLFLPPGLLQQREQLERGNGQRGLAAVPHHQQRVQVDGEAAFGGQIAPPVVLAKERVGLVIDNYSLALDLDRKSTRLNSSHT